jgi:hypothetical protein
MFEFNTYCYIGNNELAPQGFKFAMDINQLKQ